MPLKKSVGVSHSIFQVRIVGRDNDEGGYNRLQRQTHECKKGYRDDLAHFTLLLVDQAEPLQRLIVFPR